MSSIAAQIDQYLANPHADPEAARLWEMLNVDLRPHLLRQERVAIHSEAAAELPTLQARLADLRADPTREKLKKQIEKAKQESAKIESHLTELTSKLDAELRASQGETTSTIEAIKEKLQASSAEAPIRLKHLTADQQQAREALLQLDAEIVSVEQHVDRAQRSFDALLDPSLLPLEQQIKYMHRSDEEIAATQELQATKTLQGKAKAAQGIEDRVYSPANGDNPASEAAQIFCDAVGSPCGELFDRDGMTPYRGDGTIAPNSEAIAAMLITVRCHSVDLRAKQMRLESELERYNTRRAELLQFHVRNLQAAQQPELANA